MIQNRNLVLQIGRNWRNNSLNYFCICMFLVFFIKFQHICQYFFNSSYPGVTCHDQLCCSIDIGGTCIINQTEIAKDTPPLTLLGELQSVSFENSVEKWSCYKEVGLSCVVSYSIFVYNTLVFLVVLLLLHIMYYVIKIVPWNMWFCCFFWKYKWVWWQLTDRIKIQSGFVITWSSVSWYYTQHHSGWGRT